MIYVKDIIPNGFAKVDSNIDRDNHAHLNLMRKYIIQEKLLLTEEVDMFINAILSDTMCKQEITNGYKMRDKEEEEIIIESERRFKPSYRLDKKKDNPDEMRKIDNIRKRFLQEKKENSYKKHPAYKNQERYEETYRSTVRSFDTRDVALNQVLEFAIRDLLENILQELKRDGELENIKVIKTNEYDDVSAKTDYIIKIDSPTSTIYKAIDLTTSGNEENIIRKMNPKAVFCPNFHFNERIGFAIPRSLIIINDKKVVCQYLRSYMNQVQMNGNIRPQEALKIREDL